MKRLCVFPALVLALGLTLTGCGSSHTMPNVTGEKLDVAKKELKAAGFDDDPKVDGGGMFGVVIDSNWTVCMQSPAAGAKLSDTPKLTVDRSCSESTNTEAPAPSGPSTAPSSESMPPAPTEAESTETTTSTAPTTTGPLTTKNSKDLRTLLAVRDSCDSSIGVFAKKYQGKVIAFDGSVAARGGGNTLLAPGDDGANSASGPSLQFHGAAANSLRVNEKIRVTAQVGPFDADTCLLQLTGVSTQAR